MRLFEDDASAPFAQCTLSVSFSTKGDHGQHRCCVNGNWMQIHASCPRATRLVLSHSAVWRVTDARVNQCVEITHLSNPEIGWVTFGDNSY